MNKWIIKSPDPAKADELSRKGGISPLCAAVLTSRGIDTIEKASDFFNCGEDTDEEVLSDPFLIKDMREAAKIILDHIDRGEKICVYGDYDCDGITSTALLYTYLESAGADVCYHINLRSDGFGMCESAVRKLASDGVKLIITVDNGISAVAEAKLAKELGMTLVITDHHMPGNELPDAAAIVDPHRADCLSSYKDLCGCGVVLKLAAAMDGGDYSAVMEQFSDLAAIASIADVVPLTGENREIVRQGLQYLCNTENPGLRAIMEHAGVKAPITSEKAAFSIAPRINSSGRFGSASDAAALLITDDPDTAEQYAAKLEALNSERKTAESQVIKDIEEQIKNDPSVLYKRVAVLYGEGWHHGVIGIVAARLTERLCKPVFILSDDGEYARGSARSVEGFSVFGALSACGEHLTKFGGHTGAGGFSLKKENIASFDAAMQKYAAETFEHMPVYTVTADMEVRPEHLTVQSVKSLSILEPFGEGSKEPVFLIRQAEITGIIPLSGGVHTKLKLDVAGKSFYAPLFFRKTESLPYKTGDRLDLLVTPKINSFNGNESVEFSIADLRVSGISQQKYLSAREAYESFRRGEAIPEVLKKRMAPSRDELAVIYRQIMAAKEINADALFSRLDADVIPYCKMKIGLDIFEELGFITLDRFADTARLIPGAAKRAIESSEIYRDIHNMK